MAKAIGMALVVLGHVSGTGEGIVLLKVRNFVYQFHVPLFFFLSGYCFKENDSWASFSRKRIKGLYLPFVVWNLLFFAIHLVAHGLAGETFSVANVFKHVIKILLGLSITPLGGATWFLSTLFYTLFLYKSLLTVFHKMNPAKDIVILIICLLLGITGTQIRLPFGFETVLIALFFVCAGHLAKKHSFPESIKFGVRIPFVVSGLLITYLCSYANSPDIALHKYGAIPLFFIAALIGSISVLVFCSLLSRIRGISFLGDWGQRTLWILIGQFVAFKLVILVQIISFKLPWTTLFSHPCLFVGGSWALLYFIIGFFVPLLLSKCFSRIIYE